MLVLEPESSIDYSCACIMQGLCLGASEHDTRYVVDGNGSKEGGDLRLATGLQSTQISGISQIFHFLWHGNNSARVPEARLARLSVLGGFTIWDYDVRPSVVCTTRGWGSEMRQEGKGAKEEITRCRGKLLWAYRGIS